MTGGAEDIALPILIALLAIALRRALRATVRRFSGLEVHGAAVRCAGSLMCPHHSPATKPSPTSHGASPTAKRPGSAAASSDSRLRSIVDRLVRLDEDDEDFELIDLVLVFRRFVHVMSTSIRASAASLLLSDRSDIHGVRPCSRHFVIVGWLQRDGRHGPRPVVDLHDEPIFVRSAMAICAGTMDPPTGLQRARKICVGQQARVQVIAGLHRSIAAFAPALNP